MRLEQITEQDWEDDRTDGDTGCSETDYEGAFPAEVGREDGDARGEEGAEGELRSWRRSARDYGGTGWKVVG
jgi:hypothetical protein